MYGRGNKRKGEARYTGLVLHKLAMSGGDAGAGRCEARLQAVKGMGVHELRQEIEGRGGPVVALPVVFSVVAASCWGMGRVHGKEGRRQQAK